MNIQELRGKVKRFKDTFAREDVIMSAIIILVAFSSFGLGRLSRIDETGLPIKISQPPVRESLTASPVTAAAPVNNNKGEGIGDLNSETSEILQAGGKIVASKNGSKYHFPWCVGAKQISENNKIWFDSIEAARAAGYTPASNCKGLK